MLHESVNSYAVITDTSCFILLDKIDAFEVLHLTYNKILTTPEVASEFKKPLPDWISVEPVKAIHLVIKYAQQVDLGEASAIALVQETPNAFLIVDDFKGRRLASQLQIKFTGTIGVLIDARNRNVISSLRPFFDRIKLTNFRIDHILLDHILNDFDD